MSSYINALCDFYERMTTARDPDMPPDGMSSERISFALVFDKSGTMIRVDDLRDDKGDPVRLTVPAAVVRANNYIANFLWDNTGFCLGVDGKGKADKTAGKHAAFKDLHKKMLEAEDDIHAKAFLLFLNKWTPEQFSQIDQHDAMLDGNFVFRLDGDNCFLHDVPKMREIWQKANDDKIDKISLTHAKIKGVFGAQSSGASLISFNHNAFCSYGKSKDNQNESAPMPERSAKAYTTALNYLLQKENHQMVRVGDTTMVFWADIPTPLEKKMDVLFGLPLPSATENPQDNEKVALVRNIFEAIRQNRPLGGLIENEGTKFYILGLAPNAGRISVRYWLVATLGDLLRHASRWYDDLVIEKQYPSDPDFPPLWLLLAKSIAVQGETRNIPPVMAGQLAKCVIFGGRFPENVYVTILQRIHADKEINYFRAALIKAFFCRNRNKKEDWMQSLDRDETNIGYRLGRAFALMEKAQIDALGKEVKATIRERYLGSASTTPGAVFPSLIRQSQHHITKLTKDGKAWAEPYYSKLMGEILDGMTKFPATLSLDDQGCFFLGYYNQRNDFYMKKISENDA